MQDRDSGGCLLLIIVIVIIGGIIELLIEIIGAFGMAIQSSWMYLLPIFAVFIAIYFIAKRNENKKKVNKIKREERSSIVNTWVKLQMYEECGCWPAGYSVKDSSEYRLISNNREWIWKWHDDKTIDTIDITVDEPISSTNSQLLIVKTYKTKMLFPEVKINEDHSITIVEIVESYDEKNNEMKIWKDVKESMIENYWKEKETIEQKTFKQEIAKKVFECYQNAYELNELAAIDHLIICYRQGIGTERNELKVEELLRQRAEKGGIIEKYDYACYCSERGMNIKSEEWLNAARHAADASSHSDVLSMVNEKLSQLQQ